MANDWLGSCGRSQGSMVMNRNDLGRPWQATMQLAACGCLGGFQTEAGLGSGGSQSREGLLCRWMGVLHGTSSQGGTFN